MNLFFLYSSCFDIFNKHLLHEKRSKKLFNTDNIFTDADLPE